jgi:bifunctional UDP-N-acetylglucosamine pyrophosphorylase/glucosamine-1-phosphate N-acetyltransferase
MGLPIISYVIDAVRGAGIKDIIVVAGYGKELVEKAVSPARVVVQKRLLGSGDAVLSAKNFLKRYSGDLLVVCGDTPLIKPATISSLIEKHRRTNASATILTAQLNDPASYGRIVRDNLGRVMKITEKIDAIGSEDNIHEVNVGTYIFDSKCLFWALSSVRPNKKKGEIFLTDTIEVLRKEDKPIESFTVNDVREMIGINSRLELAEATKIVKEKVLRDLMEEGVTIQDPESTTVFPGSRIGLDTVIYPNTIIESGVEIGQRCHIGPFARLRPGTRLDDDVEVGNFVELVRTIVGSMTKIKHHAYLGDTVVGKNVNIGAGTITANFDGKNKNKTVIGDGSFIGIGARLVAPVKIGKKVTIGAGCVVLKNNNAPDGATVVGVPGRILKERR